MAVPTAEQFRLLAYNNGGNLTAIATALGCTRRTVEYWLNHVDVGEEFTAIVAEVKDSLIDFSENQMLQLIRGIPVLDDKGRILGWQERPDVTLIKFHLSTKGRKRGYGDALALTGKDGGPIQTEDVTKLTDEQLHERINLLRGATAQEDTAQE